MIFLSIPLKLFLSIILIAFWRVAVPRNHCTGYCHVFMNEQYSVFCQAIEDNRPPASYFSFSTDKTAGLETETSTNNINLANILNLSIY